MFSGKKILIGITGSIAAYKSALLVRLFVKAGAEVKVLMTPAAKDFITPLTLSTLSQHPVYSEMYDARSGAWTNHVELGLWADIMIIAPASANTMAKMANGICDNLLLTTWLSARCPVFVAPAMDVDMFHHASTQSNIKKITSFGNTIIPPGTGELASGLTGEGRMAEPEEILAFIQAGHKKKLPLAGKKALVTAGPTYESIDPVRFIGNHSSGKMGFAIAEALAAKGAEVTLISGPSALELKNTSIKRVNVVSAEQMYKSCKEHFKNAHITVMAAAVADFKPAQAEKKKIKKSSEKRSLYLEPTADILMELGKLKKKNQLLVGFALETDNELKHAREKLKKKNLDLIVLNSLADKGAGFKTDTNKISILGRNNKLIKFGLKSKQEAAGDIISYILGIKLK